MSVPALTWVTFIAAALIVVTVVELIRAVWGRSEEWAILWLVLLVQLVLLVFHGGLR